MPQGRGMAEGCPGGWHERGVLWGLLPAMVLAPASLGSLIMWKNAIT